MLWSCEPVTLPPVVSQCHLYSQFYIIICILALCSGYEISRDILNCTNLILWEYAVKYNLLWITVIDVKVQLIVFTGAARKGTLSSSSAQVEDKWFSPWFGLWDLFMDYILFNIQYFCGVNVTCGFHEHTIGHNTFLWRSLFWFRSGDGKTIELVFGFYLRK